MTIVQPNKNTHKFNLSISCLIMLLVVSAVWSVFLYNQSVNLRHEVETQEVGIREAEVSNAELKNTVYQMISTQEKEAELLLEERELIFDKNPEYIAAYLYTD